MNRQSYPRKAKCAHCRTQYLKKSMGHVACSPDCAIEIARLERLKRERKQLQEARRNANPTYWLDRTQRAVNALRREIDKDLPCFTCGTWDTVQREASHYRSRGACSSARFDYKRNIRTCCHRCNVHLAGNAGVFRARLAEELGEEEVQALEAMPKSYRWTREECQKIELDAKAKTAELRRLAA